MRGRGGLRAFWAATGALLAALTLDALFPPRLEAARPYSVVVAAGDGAWLRAFTTPAGRWRLEAQAAAIDPRFIAALIAVEDKRFAIHPGVDPLALARAGGSFLARGEVVSGGSTLTMQLARLLAPRPRTLGAKLIEIVRAVQIERRLTKQAILGLYLTLAPYGGNLEGVRAASRAYFGKEPTALTDAEIALLLALPQAPEVRRPDRRPAAARAARRAILARMADAGLITPAAAREADASPLPARQPFPVAAAHAAQRLKPLAPGGGTLVSTLDARVQALTERRLARLAEGLGAASAAALVIDVATREVRAAVGSANPDAPGGQIDMTRAMRSPGSTLKPFVYALAFEDGLAAPGTLIDDLPTRFSGYMPENFDRTFHGAVRVREALAHSLNVPAVAALDRIGAGRLRAALEAAGARLALPQQADEAGLALALGGAGLRMDDHAALYAALADGGRARALVWTRAPAAAPARATQVFDPDAAAKVAAILRDGPTPAGRAPMALAADAPQIAVKTGTSYGFRDAWAAGFDGRSVIVVWVGRPDGAPRPGATGRSAALPVLMDLFDLAGAGGRAAPDAAEDTPEALARFETALNAGPALVFPPDGAELVANGARGFALAARGGAGALTWHADGAPLARDPLSGRTIWRPDGPGFYRLRVVDAEGRAADARVRVRPG